MLDLQNAEIFRAALESLQTGVCMVDRDRKISFWNDGAERITGYLRQDVLGRFCGEILLVKFHGNKVALCEHACPLVAAMRGGKARESRVYLHHKSGYAVPISLRAAPIRDVHGHVIGAVESFVERPCVSTRRRPDSDLVVGRGLDAVTQLPDYPFTGSYLVDRLKFASEHVIPFGLLRIQLDHLDTLMATHGLDAAETILNVVAHTLRNGLDPLDFVGRWSEDQFLAIVANCGNGDLLATAERLKQLAQSSEIVWWGDQVSITVSVGGTVLKPGEPVESLLDRTGNALKQAVAKAGNFAIVLCAPETP
ncbi:MAG: PAS domain-containing protein [Terriglobia bacterium]|jgi:diguanylate cyclase (GGDEF)-like protein/PAS domain S-box-containing protein